MSAGRCNTKVIQLSYSTIMNVLLTQRVHVDLMRVHSSLCR
ncbi:hypothetical protein [Nocardioides jiangxiensis]|uniref:Uncharacterized protein n=1 Tax=Nocardioides jiangxiensis TaxID=3064524 RepID=A0ABT9B2D8_9ACTN|nr:hypothetical protein [Nocardioides sp. WY-20]MDO7868930.1 hypothetical protein [Nocardioides sp. WY-20]